MADQSTENIPQKSDEEVFKQAFLDAAKRMKEAEDRAEKPFWDHLAELRDRVFRCVWVGLLCTCVAYVFRDPIMDFLKQPLFAVLPEGQRHLVFTGVFESFVNSLRVSAIAGLFLSLPFITYQVWGFIAPGLHVHERKMAVPFIFAGTAFFLMGAAFAYYFVFPHGFRFMIEFGYPEDLPMISVKEYFGMIFRLFLLFGLSFEFPVILMFLARLGIVDAPLLREHRRTAIIAISVLSAVVAPPDALSMVLMMIPLYIFYEGVILLVSFQSKKR